MLLASYIPQVIGVPKIQNWVTWHTRYPFWPNFAFFSLVLTADHLCAKLEIFSFIHPPDNRGSQKYKIGSPDPTWPFWPYFAFFSIILTVIHICAKFEVSSIIRPRDISGSQNSKKWVTWPHVSRFDLILHFLVSTHCHPSLCQIWSF